MTDLLERFEKLRNARHAFTRRFFPVTLVCVIAAIYQHFGIGDALLTPTTKPVIIAGFVVIGLALWGSATTQLPHEKFWLRRARQLLDELRWKEAEKLLENSPWFMSFSARIRQMEALIQLKIDTNDLLAAYEKTVAAEQAALLKGERHSIRLLKAEILYQTGNFKAFREAIDNISKDTREIQPRSFRYLFQKSRLSELDGSFSDAKFQLEEAIEAAETSEQRSVAYNNLARLEDAQGNDNNALSYYEQAWDNLQKDSVPRLYPIIAHNLLLKYARAGKTEKALTLLEHYRSMLDTNNPEQQLQLLNDQTHLARQLNDRDLLLNAYERVEKNVLPHLSELERFVVAVTELRMRLSDGVDFSNHFNKVCAQLALQKNLTAEERFNVLSALELVCKQNSGALSARQVETTMTYVIEELLSMEELIDDQLRKNPPSLPGLRDIWHKRKVTMEKLKIIKAIPQIPKSLLTSLFGVIQERQAIWAEKNNAEREIDALIVFCDEYVAYGLGFGQDFLIHYRSQALGALEKAENIISREWPHPAMHQYAFGVAYFLWKIAGDTPKAAMWLARFESRGISLLHYLDWLRQQYAELKSGLRQTNHTSSQPASAAPLLRGPG